MDLIDIIYGLDLCLSTFLLILQGFQALDRAKIGLRLSTFRPKRGGNEHSESSLRRSNQP